MSLQALRRWWPVAAVAALVVAAAIAAAHATPQLEHVSRPRFPNDSSPTLGPDAKPTVVPSMGGSTGVDLPDWLPMLFKVLLLVLGAVVVALMVWSLASRLLRVPGKPDGADPVDSLAPAAAEAEVLAAVDAGVAELSDEDGDPRRAVIACWLRLERAAAASGVPQHLGDTATDLVVRLLSGGAGGRVVSAGVLAGFAETYLKARYATHSIDDWMRRQARDALHRLRAELTTAAQP